MEINNSQKFTPNFLGISSKQILNGVKNYVTKPQQYSYDKSFKILGIATSAITTATIMLNKKQASEEIPTWEEIKSKIIEMKLKNGEPRFDEYSISNISRAYKENPELTSKLINLKQNNNWYIWSGSDIYYAVNSYKIHPDFTNYLIEQIESGLKGDSAKILAFFGIKNTNQDLLTRLLNCKDTEGNVKMHGYIAGKVISFYEKNPELCERILSQRNAKGDYIWIDSNSDTLAEACCKYPKIASELMDVEDIKGEKLNAYSISKAVLLEKEKRDFCVDILKTNRFTIKQAEIIYDSEIPNEVFLELINLKDSENMYVVQCDMIEKLSELSLDKINIFKELIIRGIKNETAIEIVTSENVFKTRHLLDLGFNLEECSEILKSESKYENIIKEIEENPSSMRKFLASPDFIQKLKENSAGKYQEELLEMFNPETMPYKMKEQLLKSGLSEEDFLLSLKKISKSCFRLAYDTPNQYLSIIDDEYTVQINGHYIELPKEELESERKKVAKFFADNIGNISRLLKYIDNDTFNHLMDKRFILFQEDLETLNALPEEALEDLSELLKCKSQKTGKTLSPKEKIQLCQLIPIFYTQQIDSKEIKNALKEKKLDIKDLKDAIYQEILKFAGIDISVKDIKEGNKLNADYAYLALRPSAFSLLPENEKEEIKKQIIEQINLWRENPEDLEESIVDLEATLNNSEIDYLPEKLEKLRKQIIKMLKNIDKYTNDEIFNQQWEEFKITTNMYSGEEELFTTIKHSTIGDFKEFINNPNNKYGKTNEKTKKLFIQKGLNYEKWLNPDLADLKLNIANKNMTIRFWDRNPLEDLFLGSKTTCCTALNRTNGSATSIYLLSTCWNVIELYDENGKVVGMSRVFAGEMDGENVIIMDNIELNNTYLKNINKSQLVEIRNGFFKYINEYAQKVIGNKDAKVYFYAGDIHVPTEDLDFVKKAVDFIGFVPTPNVYINSANCTWIETDKLKNREYKWLKVPENK